MPRLANRLVVLFRPDARALPATAWPRSELARVCPARLNTAQPVAAASAAADLIFLLARQNPSCCDCSTCTAARVCPQACGVLVHGHAGHCAGGALRRRCLSAPGAEDAAHRRERHDLVAAVDEPELQRSPLEEIDHAERHRHPADRRRPCRRTGRSLRLALGPMKAARLKAITTRGQRRQAEDASHRRRPWICCFGEARLASSRLGRTACGEYHRPPMAKLDRGLRRRIWPAKLKCRSPMHVQARGSVEGARLHAAAPFAATRRPR